ncbi:hypothetical protein HHL19_19630 [Streptomyces sp. R302]|uniref:hypothetical protein n=1 Tax=unclassified Streptomyces TaxID=2593676 RepID=UPI00145CDBD5|nr:MULTISPECIES: hypothetical protein [unclassified Streptomyces]NML50723.1 hypothetical protein [Streptomyces sp. R301]NML80818.1 hypothetical protein [Streptomyces sp. R302]
MTEHVPGWESALLVGGPADGARVRVQGRPGLVQVTYPCEVEDPADGMRATAVYLYRRDSREPGPLRYGYDPAAP